MNDVPGASSLVAERPGDTADAPRRVTSGRGGVAGFLRRHWAIALLLVAGVAVRALVVHAYRPAFWFPDSSAYVRASEHLNPATAHGANLIGYPLLLRLLSVTGSISVVTVLQHLMALALVVVAYAFLRRRGLPGWLAALGVAPTALDGRQITLEHYLLAETLFTVLLMSALLLLLWRERPSWLVCGITGVLAASAALTRSVGVGVCGVVLLYLIVRRVGWKQVVAFTVAVGALLGGYLTWAHANTGRFSFTIMQGHYLYARTALVADCDRLQLTDQQRELCPREPLGQRPERADYYLWSDPNIQRFGLDQDDFVGTFAKEVLRQQPVDFAVSVAGDLAHYLLPGQKYGPDLTCLGNWWVMPADLRDVPGEPRCKQQLNRDGAFVGEAAPNEWTPSSRSREFLADYSRAVQVPPAALGLAVLLALAAVVWRVRRPGFRVGLDALLFAAVGVALLVLAVATSMLEPRYGIPSITLLSVGGVLAVHRLRTTFSTSPPNTPARIDGRAEHGGPRRETTSEKV
ncbi:hypothetical protein [Streptoalloteichus hindustanus]|uniref:Dolichyl-phosphate-mannose-protein mannosyltransferase n=1 Tax=Streptoalloteichus hindustanus TaxID=2017 RepID=A0A1M4YKG9_STRHI|nr:hypothetical protein [Streptoalloteichus hindustanus]SHF06230.1 hypothetical protein SAMN05444320_102393 [Streptoalloteichus hindustanus]